MREAAVVGVARRTCAARCRSPTSSRDASLDAAALDAVCRRALASFKVPRAFVRVDALPRNALGKVQKHLLPALERPGMTAIIAA